MAGSTCLVSRATRWAIIALLAVVLFAIAMYFRHGQTAYDAKKVVRYSATGSELDLAVVSGITKADKNFVTPAGSLYAAIVPHHLVASEAVAAGIKGISLSSPRVVVIISPDHFEKCPTLFCTSYGGYGTFFGDTFIEDGAVQALLANQRLVAEMDLSLEHGIYSIVPFIKHYSPEVTIVPVVVSVRGRDTAVTRQEILSMLQTLAATAGTAFVFSTDFSHYLPLSEANEADDKTREIFCSGASDALLGLENPGQSDCPLCLWLAKEIATEQGYWNPVEVWHSNSANLLADTSVTETTSHFTFLLGDTTTLNSCSK